MSTNISHPSSPVTGLGLFLPRQVHCFEFKHFTHGCSGFPGWGRSPTKQEQLPTCWGWHQPKQKKSPPARWQLSPGWHPHWHCMLPDAITQVNLGTTASKKIVCKARSWAMPNIHVPVCSMFASFLGCLYYKPASNYILTFCFYHSEFGRGQKGEKLTNTHGSNHKHLLTFTQFCNTNKTDMPSSAGQCVSACRWFQLPNQHFAHSEVSGFNTDFAACCNHSVSSKRYEHPFSRPPRGLQP